MKRRKVNRDTQIPFHIFIIGICKYLCCMFRICLRCLFIATVHGSLLSFASACSHASCCNCQCNCPLFRMGVTEPRFIPFHTRKIRIRRGGPPTTGRGTGKRSGFSKRYWICCSAWDLGDCFSDIFPNGPTLKTG